MSKHHDKGTANTREDYRGRHRRPGDTVPSSGGHLDIAQQTREAGQEIHDRETGTTGED